MAAWTTFPHAGEFSFDARSVRRQWNRLHAGDAEPPPRGDAALQAWALFHAGEFQRAAELGLSAGGEALAAANKATAVYATYIESSERIRLDLLLELAQRAQAQTQAAPDDASAWYSQAYALGRYSQAVSVAKALAQGLGGKVRHALERAIALRPTHADAHLALGAYHAEVIDKVGALIGGMIHGANRQSGLSMFREGLRLDPHSVIGRIEYANGLLMLEGAERQDQANALYEQAAACEPLDAFERLSVERARLELQD